MVHIVAFSDEKILFSTGVVLGLHCLRIDLRPTAFSQHGFYRRSLPTATDAVDMILNAQIPRERGLKAQHIDRDETREEKGLHQKTSLGAVWCDPYLCLPTLF